jgi:DNA-binding NarL/FixJ family response regulator
MQMYHACVTCRVALFTVRHLWTRNLPFVVDRRDTAEVRDGGHHGSTVGADMGRADTRVIVADDRMLVVDGLCALLGGVEGFTVDRVGSLGALRPILLDSPIDIALVRVDLPDGDAVDIIDLVRAKALPTRVVVVADHPAVGRVGRCIDRGAHGFLLTTQSFDEIVASLRVVADGGHVLAPGAVAALLARAESGAARRDLSRREVEVLQSLATTGSTRGAATDLSIEPSTVRNHIHRAMAKLGAHSMVEAVVVAIQHEIIELPPLDRGDLTVV